MENLDQTAELQSNKVYLWAIMFDLPYPLSNARLISDFLLQK